MSGAMLALASSVFPNLVWEKLSLVAVYVVVIHRRVATHLVAYYLYDSPIDERMSPVPHPLVVLSSKASSY